MAQARNVLITGASSGFGLLIARTLLTHGHTVFATMRDVEGRNAGVAKELEALAAQTPGRLHVLELDVTSDASVEAAIARVLETAGKLDVVVNNAGIGVGGFAEAFTVEQYHKVFDVNLFGVQRVNRAVLPSMRAAGSGLLIHVSSIMGRLVIPFAGPYTAAKWALEGLVESYRYELAKTGVDVALVQPGGFLTGFAERMVTPADSVRLASYGPLREMPDRLWGGMMEQLKGDGAPDPQEVADAVLRLIETPAGSRPLRVVVDPMTGGEAAETINGTSEQIQTGLLQMMGMPELASVKPE